MYGFSGSSGLGPIVGAGTGVATGTGLAFTGFPVIGCALLGVVLVLIGLVATRMAMVEHQGRRGTTPPRTAGK